MTKFEQELRKLFDHDKLFSDVRFVGNTCYGRLTDQIRVKVSFQTGIVADRYDRLKITLLNRNEGPIDSLVLRLKDIWGVKPVANNPNFRNGVCPYLWDCDGKVEWYAYRPTSEDYQKLTEAAGNYLDVFREPVQETQMGQRIY